MLSNLVLTGGWAHDFTTTSTTLVEVMAPVAHSTVVDDMDAAAALLNEREFDVITIYACWFTMTDPRYTEEQRATWARTTPAAFRSAVEGHHSAGGGLCVLHTGILCFTDWPEWPGLVGGSWVWGKSWHPAPAPMRLVRHTGRPPVRAPHAIVEGLGSIEVVDERYCDIEAHADARILMTSSGPEGEFPSVWVRDAGTGRSVYSSIGHDSASLTTASHARLLRRCVAWAGGGDDGTVSRLA